MPIRTYSCPCGHRLERIFLSRSNYEEATLDLCPQCGNLVEADLPLPGYRRDHTIHED